ncbi:transposase [Bradyrhizobium sp. Rc2d]|nr:transposase [Bradyrhizobium sp. Rc2d]
MEKIITVGLDLAKSIFQVHGIAEDGEVLVRRTLRRSQVLPFFRGLPACLVGMEACASAHHWAREIAALGHSVRMMPPAYVSPTSNETRPTWQMPKPFARRSPARQCGSYR